MSAKVEKIIVASLLVIFAVAFGSTLIMKGFSLTKEEAIEISRNSETVQKEMEYADRYNLEVHYLNSTQVDEIRDQYPLLREQYPEHRGIWRVIWYIHNENDQSASAIAISHVIDEETGEIFHEGLLGAR